MKGKAEELVCPPFGEIKIIVGGQQEACPELGRLIYGKFRMFKYLNDHQG